MAKNDDNSALLLLLLGGAGIYFLTRDKEEKIITGSGGTPPVLGCTDSQASNYNSLAEGDDGSCVYDTPPVDVLGCTDSSASNYDASANLDDGSCQYPIYGCTNPSALNYDSTAEVDDGTCNVAVWGCTNPSSMNYNPLATINTGCIAYIYGCTDPNALNYVSYANTDDGSCDYTTPIGGCMSPEACNYDPSATFQSGQCNFPYTGYDCDGNCISDINGDGVCDGLEIYGCTDAFADNYDSSANVDDGSCFTTVEGCTDPAALNHNSSANTDNGSCNYAYEACTNSNAVNYDDNPDAITNNSLCVFPVDLSSFGDSIFSGVYDDECLPSDFDSEIDIWVEEDGAEWMVSTDPNSDYYGLYAYNGSYITAEELKAVLYQFMLDNPTWYPMCPEEIFGCTNPNATNYSPNANVDNGSCQYPQGCTDPSAENYDPNAFQNDGSCDYISADDEDFMNYFLLEIAGTTNVSQLDEWSLTYFAPFFGPENIVDGSGNVVTGVNYPQVNGIAEFEAATSSQLADFCVQTSVSQGNPVYGDCMFGSTAVNFYGGQDFVDEFLYGANPDNPYAPDFQEDQGGGSSSAN